MSSDVIRSSHPLATLPAQDSIIAVDARALERGCMARVLASEFEDYQIFEADSAAALSRSAFGQPRLVILRIHPEQQSDAAIAQELADIRRLCSDPFIALVCDDDERSLHYAFQHGCHGYLPTSLPLKIAVAALRLVLVGGQYFPQPARALDRVATAPKAVRRAAVEECHVEGDGIDRECGVPVAVFAEPGATSHGVVYPAPSSSILAPPVEKAAALDFTPREREVIEALRCGRSNKLIASDLSLSENTVKVHVRHIMRKLSATNRTQAALRSQLLFSTSESVN